MNVWAVVPVKERDRAKERLASFLPRRLRERLALAMLEDVLLAAAATESLAGIVVVTVDPAAGRLARRLGARLVADGARDGHTGAVAAAARLLRAEGRAGMLTVPGDIPLATAAELGSLLAAHRPAPSFTIAPSHDERGSNAVLVSPPDAVPLRFGADSFFPHLRAAAMRCIRPAVLRLPGIALDIDNPEDLAAFARRPSATRSYALLAENAMLGQPCAAADPTGAYRQ
jgi:2-phospho-L-lactate/phosphoenolpyruvate guanylyltransferase